MRHIGKVQGTLAAAVTVGFFGVIWVLASMDLHTSMKDAMLIMVGALGAAFGGVINFYFGSSSGSALKTQALMTGKFSPIDEDSIPPPEARRTSTTG